MIRSNVEKYALIFLYNAKASHKMNLGDLLELLGKLDLFLSIHHNLGDNGIKSRVINERVRE